MYSLPYFKEQDQGVVVEFMKANPFALLIGSANDQPAATQVPLLLEERAGRIYLRGHIMRQTDHHKALVQNSNVLCVFTGPHAYISASWYTNPQVASTWNYMSVHARGKLTFLDEASLLNILEQTTALFENNPSSPALFHHLSEEYVQRLSKAIVGFEIEVTEIDHTFKLSQNRDKESYGHIIGQLQAQGSDAARIAAEMEARKKPLFNDSTE